MSNRKCFTDYAEEWIDQHPFWVFMMGIERERIHSWENFGPGSPYENNPKEGGMLSLVPFKSGSHVIAMVGYVVLSIFITYWSVFFSYSFDTLIIISSVFAFCHLVYMYFFTRLPIMSHDTYKSKHFIAEMICICGLFIPLLLVNFNYTNQQKFEEFVTKYELKSKYSEEAMRKVYWSILHSEDEQKNEERNLRKEISTLREQFNLPKQSETEIKHRPDCPHAKPSRRAVQRETVTHNSDGRVSKTYTYDIVETYQP